jgi:putative transposase
VRRLRETGSVAPGQMGGHKPPKIRGEHRTWLLERVTVADFTLRGWVAELAERGLKVDYHTVWSFVHGAKLSFKKKPWWLASAHVATSRADARNGSSTRAGLIPRAWYSSTRPGGDRRAWWYLPIQRGL